MTKHQTVLTVINEPHPQASVFKIADAPALWGNEDAQLVCGLCRLVLVDGVSVERASKILLVPFQLVIICPKCGANNILPTSVKH